VILTVAASRFKINKLGFSIPLDWGAWGREFESRRPDHYNQALTAVACGSRSCVVAKPLCKTRKVVVADWWLRIIYS